MEILGVLDGLSLVEWLIFGFIGMNMSLSGAYLLQRGVKRFGADKE